MKILYLVTKSNWGGAQKYVYDIATSFSARGHECVVGFGGNGELAERLESAHIRTHSFTSLARDIRVFKEIKSCVDIALFIYREKPDIIHVNSSKAGGLGAVIGRLLGVKRIIFTVHGAPFREERMLLSRYIIYIVTWITCLLAHAVITVSKQDERDIARMIGVSKKVTTIYNGLTYDLLPERTRPKERTTYILTVGELVANKGLAYALEAVSMLKNSGKAFHYTIFGEGKERSKLERYITMKGLHDHVTLRGHKTNLEDEWHNYDVFLLPSIKEGLPYTLIEAGRAMLPVVTTTTGGIPEIVRHEETGLLVPPKDSIRLAEALSRYMDDRNTAKKHGISLHDHVVQHFSHSKMIVETAKVYGLVGKKA